MKIYTKTGDEGSTGLLGGDRIAKDSLRITAIGEVDEVNAALGLARSMGVGELDAAIAILQSRLFDLGAELAAPAGSKFDAAAILPSHGEWIEQRIDALTESLPPLKAFILPGGTSGSSSLHLARAICRRAERAILALHAEEPVRKDARVFLNRLSDYLFVAARFANAAAGVSDCEWHRHEER